MQEPTNKDNTIAGIKYKINSLSIGIFNTPNRRTQFAAHYNYVDRMLV
jgi:hypothetical protein